MMPTSEPSRLRTEAFLVVPQRVRQYAEAVGERNAAYYDGSCTPPSFAVVPIIPCVVSARQSVTRAPGLHGEHDLRIHAPLRPGMKVAVEASVGGVWPTVAGLTIIVQVTTTEVGGVLLNEQHFSVLVPGESRDKGYGIRFPDHRMPVGATSRIPIAERRYKLDRSLGRRYAEASGDLSPYTFDEVAAQSRGLPGIIVGGICTLSFATRAAVEALGADDPTSVKRIALRFSRLLLLSDGQELAFRFWADPFDSGSFRFEASDKDGTTVATHGLVSLAT